MVIVIHQRNLVDLNFDKVWDQLLEAQTDLLTTGIVQYNTAGDPIQRLATTTREGTEEPTEEADDTDETSASGYTVESGYLAHALIGITAKLYAPHSEVR